MIPFARNKM